ncbi:hypothetical protein BC830DRAFT_1165313 [Chytriomyces sp. MP71]|nr:hypothetical protein BC830DRAFT_1165313 [Chytriomyces sp. MP71]
MYQFVLVVSAPLALASLASAQSSGGGTSPPSALVLSPGFAVACVAGALVIAVAAAVVALRARNRRASSDFSKLGSVVDFYATSIPDLLPMAPKDPDTPASSRSSVLSTASFILYPELDEIAEYADEASIEEILSVYSLDLDDGPIEVVSH